MMREKDALQIMDELEKNGVDIKEELKEAAKELPEMVKETVTDGYKKIEQGVVEGYKKIEESVVGGYKKIEQSAVEGFNKATDKCVEKLFAKEGEETFWRIRKMDSVMCQENTFSYKYSAKENEEIQEIRRRYMPQSESKMDELKRLDKRVQSSGMVEGLTAGISGLLIFGLGMCFSMQVFAEGVLFIILGVFIGIVGAAVMAVAYPIYRKFYKKAKEKYTPRILELVAELSGENV